MAKQQMAIPADADEVMILAINKANEEIQAVFDRVEALKKEKAEAKEAKRLEVEAEAEANRFKLNAAEANLESLEQSQVILDESKAAAKKEIAELKKALGIKATRTRKPKDVVEHQEVTTQLGEPEKEASLTDL